MWSQDTTRSVLLLVGWNKKGTRCLVVYLGHYTTGELAHRELILQVRGWRVNGKADDESLKTLLYRNPVGSESADLQQ
jgi:hypothetical protein